MTLVLAMIFLGLTSKAKAIQAKTKQVGLHQTKSLLHSKGNHKQDRQPSELDKIFANESTDKGLTSKIYKQLMQLNIKKNKQPNEKMGRRPK